MAREWVISRGEFGNDVEGYDEDAFRAAVTQEMAGLENLGHRTGGVYIATPVRRAVPEHLREFPEIEEYETLAWVFQQKFMPAARVVEPQVEAVPDVPQDTPGDGSPELEVVA